MTAALQHLIKEARTELGSDACRAGKHQWESEGGRACPHGLDDNCGQAVYRCAVCGSYDYGEGGGPGDLDCYNNCRHRTERWIAIKGLVVDPLTLWRENASRHRLVLKALKRQPKPRLP